MSKQLVIDHFLSENPEYLSIVWENDTVYATFMLKPGKQFCLSDFTEGSTTYRLLQKLTRLLKETDA